MLRHLYCRRPYASRFTSSLPSPPPNLHLLFFFLLLHLLPPLLVLLLVHSSATASISRSAAGRQLLLLIIPISPPPFPACLLLRRIAERRPRPLPPPPRTPAAVPRPARGTPLAVQRAQGRSGPRTRGRGATTRARHARLPACVDAGRSLGCPPLPARPPAAATPKQRRRGHRTRRRRVAGATPWATLLTCGAFPRPEKVHKGKPI